MSNLDYILRQHSALYLFLKDMNARIRFRDPTGKNIPQKAMREENYTSGLMIAEPDNPKVQEAWDIALNRIQRMTDMAKEEGIPLILLVTPFDFQFGLEKAFAHPQRILREFATEHNIYYVDLLEILWGLLVEKVDKEKSADQIIAETRESGSNILWDFWGVFYIDYDHPSPLGNELIASILQPIVLNALGLTTK